MKENVLFVITENPEIQNIDYNKLIEEKRKRVISDLMMAQNIKFVNCKMPNGIDIKIQITKLPDDEFEEFAPF